MELPRVSHTMSVPIVVERLRDQHGGEKARKLALLEQQKARRARSRRRFDFWSAVADQIGCGEANGSIVALRRATSIGDDLAPSRVS